MYKKMISLTAIMAMIVTLVMPARAYADETQAESQPVLKYSVLMSGASEWQEADNGEYVGEPENKDAEISKLKLDVLDSVTEENLNGITYSVADAEGNWNEYVTAGQETGFDSEQKIAAFKIKLTEELAEKYNIYYRAYVQTDDQSEGQWLGWAENDAPSGTKGYDCGIKAIQVQLTEKSTNVDLDTANSYIVKTDIVPEETVKVVYQARVAKIGWQKKVEDGALAGTEGKALSIEALKIKLAGLSEEDQKDSKIIYKTHVQSYGWQKEVENGALAGTTGQGKRIEAIKITLPDSDYTGNVEYRAYVQGIGWQSWKKNGELAGTSGQSKRIEAIRVKLTGEIAKYYEVYYSIHLAKIGWCNYESAGRVTGTIDLSKKIEALKICLVKKDAETAPNTSGVKYVEGYKSGNFYYNGYIKGVGATGNVSQGNTVGTIGKKQQLQSLTLYLDQSNKLAPSGTIQYATHIAKEGWKDWSDAGTTNGASTGTNGMEAVKIRLTGNLAKYYDIYYRAHVQGYGWLGWAKNGQAAGTSKIGYRMEGLQIRLVSKDAAAPGKNANYYTEKKKTATIAVKDQMHLRALAYASNTRYLILVDTTANRVGIYSGSVGKWNEVKKWVCTTGAKSTPTVKGTFTVQGKGKSFGSGYTCWYYTQFYGNYLFHSVLYKQGSMSVIIDGRLGINASHGCVRLNINNAKWIYDNIPRGTKVVVY